MTRRVEIIRIDNGVETKAKVTELPIRWVPACDPLDETYGENETQWSMCIPQVGEEARAFAETTWRLCHGE